jgi:hypothetical protein
MTAVILQQAFQEELRHHEQYLIDWAMLVSGLEAKGRKPVWCRLDHTWRAGAQSCFHMSH